MTNKYVEALNVEKRKLSEANKKKASALALICQNEKVADFLEKCKFDARNVSDLYLTDKVIKAAKALTASDVSIKDFNDNTFAALKTALLCKAAKADISKTQLHASVNLDVKLSDDAEKLTFRRKSRMTTRQQQLNVRLIEALNIANFRDSKEVMKLDVKSHALKVAQSQIADMTL